MNTLEKSVTMGDNCLVLRPFNGERRYVKGEVVNVKSWKHVDALVDQRYLRRLPMSYKPTK